MNGVRHWHVLLFYSFTYEMNCVRSQLIHILINVEALTGDWVKATVMFTSNEFAAVSEQIVFKRSNIITLCGFEWYRQ